MREKQDQGLIEFVQMLKEAGFRVIAPDGYITTYIVFEKDNRLGYVQRNTYKIDYDYSTKHKPCREYGTGFEYRRMVELKVEYCLKTLESGYHSRIEKWKSLEEYMNDNINRILKWQEI